MPDLDAYRASLRPHTHVWQPLIADHDWCPAHDWCPGCGATRPRPEPDDNVVAAVDHRLEAE